MITTSFNTKLKTKLMSFQGATLMLHFYLVRIYLLFASTVRPITIIWLFDIDLDLGTKNIKNRL